jgi:hypothetical protein
MRTRQHGRYGKRRPINKPAISLGPSLTGVIPAHPASVDYLGSKGWLMLGNDVEGDCVAVTWANLRRLTTAVLTTEFYPPQKMVDAVYATQNGPGEDNGMDIQTLLEYLVKTGGPDGVKALGFAKVDHTNTDQVKAALAIFGGLWVGIQVLDVNETQFDAGQPWDYSARGQAVGGHSVLTGGYGTPGPGPLGGDERFITWAQETSFTDRFWANEVDECWAVIWPEHLGSKAFLAGVDLGQLAADYTALTGRPFPAPVPVPPVPVPVPPVPVPPTPVPVPPVADYVDKAFATPATLAWARATHVAANKKAAAAFKAWAQAKGLWVG